MRLATFGIRLFLVSAVAALALIVAPLAVAAESDPWTLIGSQLTGGANGGVALSGDGTIAAVGSPENDTAATDAGVVRVYSQIAGAWVQRGADIPGGAVKDVAGTSVALSKDGLVLAVGAPGYSFDMGEAGPSGWVRVYEWNGTAWAQRGDRLTGVNDHDRFGYSVALSDDGSILAVGSPRRDAAGTNAGRTTMYTWTSGTWMQARVFDGASAGDQSGWSVALSGDGSRIAIGARYAGGSLTGQVRVFSQAGASGWIDTGGVLNGVAWSGFGTSVSLSDDGAVLAVGAPDDATSDGRTYTYVLTGGVWTLRGTVGGERDNDLSGKSVALSADGAVLAIGADDNDDAGLGAGHVRVFRWDGSGWARRGIDIDGSASGDLAGRAVALSDNGRRVAVTLTGALANVGAVRVYTHMGSLAPPSAPRSVTGAAADASATVSWSAPYDDGGETITGYTATASGGASCSVTSTAPAAPARSCVISGLVNGTSYTFTVTATNAQGTGAASTVSPAATPHTLPGAPTNVGGVGGAGFAVVSWTAPASDGGATITGYTATAGTGESCSVASVAPATPATTCVISGLTNGASYTFTVRATNVWGTGSVSVASASVLVGAQAQPAAAAGDSTRAAPAAASPSAAAPAAVTKPTAAATRTGGNVTVAVAIPTASIGAKVVIMRKVGNRYVAVSTTKATGSALTIPLKVKGRPGSTQLRVVVGGKVVKSLKV